MDECKTCGKRFQTARGLSWHTERAHTESSEDRAPSPHQKVNDAPEGPKGTLELSGPSVSGPSAKIDVHSHDPGLAYWHLHADGGKPHSHGSDGQPRFEAQSEQAHEPLICGATTKVPWDDGRTATAVCGSPEGHDGRHIAVADSTTGGEGQGAVTWADGDDPLRLVPLEPKSEEMDPAEVLPGPDPDDPDSTTGGSDRPRRRIRLLPIFRFGKRRTDS